MAEIVLTPEQLEIYRDAVQPVKIRDTRGIVLGVLEPGLTPEFIAELKRRARAPGPRYSGAHIQRMFQFLENAWQKEGSFDEQRLQELLRDFNAKDPECNSGE